MSQEAFVSDPKPSDRDSHAIVQAVTREISHIATLPEVTLKIIRLVEDPDSTAQDLNNVISHDPALGARILKVVNSAFYGLPGQIGSTNRAIVLLGLNAVKNIAVAASLTKLFRGGQICPSFSARDLWKHCIAVGSGTRLLATKAKLGLPDEAFLAGLIHDIGIMVEIQARRPQFIEVMERLDKDPDLSLRDAELAVIGANHEQFGAELCRLWKFPTTFSWTTGFHHRPNELDPQNRRLTILVHMADILAGNFELGFSRGLETQEIDPELIIEAGFNQTDIDEVKAALPDATDQAMVILQDAS